MTANPLRAHLDRRCVADAAYADASILLSKMEREYGHLSRKFPAVDDTELSRLMELVTAIPKQRSAVSGLGQEVAWIKDEFNNANPGHDRV